jgi:CRISPR/Cas system-associated exonuclease Cas4 (RecB family)
MKQPILESLALYLTGSDGPDLKTTRIILPNRRAGMFLQRHLARYSQEVQWAPHIYSINDFISNTSILDLSDQVEALLILYEAYAQLAENPEPIDEFYFWGEIMLRDFDELDKYLVDAEMLFRNIIDLKELEEPLAGLEPSQIDFIRQFWTGFHEGDQTREKDQFIGIWELLPQLYKRLKRNLIARNEGLQGMQYRDIAQRIETGEISYSWEGQTIIAGFNALNSCEIRIFSWLEKQGAKFFWDYDHRYIHDPVNEAGRFLRNNLKRFPDRVKLEEFNGLSNEKEIRIFELPTDVLQAKTVHRILEESDSGASGECTDTALVLCDEELLMPVVMSLPEDTGEINITMGYPMKNSPVYSLVDSLLRMQNNHRHTKAGKVSFYHKDVVSILLHPYMRNLDDLHDEALIQEITKSNLIQVDSQIFQGDFEKKVFRSLSEARDLLNYIRDIFTHTLEHLASETEPLKQSLDKEFIFQLLIHLNKLDSLLLRQPQITYGILERLLRKQLSGLRIPFEGEPLSGLQVMGILETRLLDFRRVILISMNEEVMPASQSGQSYIPYALRMAYRMPAREDKDAIYAYYFQRLLQRAEKVDLLFCSASEGVRTGEMSRYLYQLMYRLNIPIIRPGLEVVAREAPPIVIEHSAEVERKLARYLANDEMQKYLSPSAINTYIDCSLKFYLRYLAGIGEPDEVLEEIDAAGFGTVVHDTIRELYDLISDRNNGIVTVEELKKLKASTKPEEVLKRTFIKEHFKGRKVAGLEGRNIVIFRVMLRYLEKIVDTDLKIAPFALVSAEKSYNRNLKIPYGDREMEVRLGGKIDRVDRVEGILRVIDYKTGNARQGFPGMDTLFNGALLSRNGPGMQTMFYAWLVAGAFPGEQILPGLYIMKALYGKEFHPALTIGSHRQKSRIDSFSEYEEEYLVLLKNLLSQLFDPDTPFIQREHDAKCNYCDFASICNRNPIQ